MLFHDKSVIELLIVQIYGQYTSGNVLLKLMVLPFVQ